jgi:hypothetical protein
MSITTKKTEVKKMTDTDRNFNNTIDEYYSSEIGSEFNDDLSESEIDEVLYLIQPNDAWLKAAKEVLQQFKNNEVKK